jgi:hypothetical protein
MLLGHVCRSPIAVTERRTFNGDGPAWGHVFGLDNRKSGGRLQWQTASQIEKFLDYFSLS